MDSCRKLSPDDDLERLSRWRHISIQFYFFLNPLRGSFLLTLPENLPISDFSKEVLREAQEGSTATKEQVPCSAVPCYPENHFSLCSSVEKLGFSNRLATIDMKAHECMS